MDKFLETCFRNGNVQLFVGSGLSKDLYPDADELRDKFLDDEFYMEGHRTKLRTILGKSVPVSLDDAAEFYELYQGADKLCDVIKHVYGVTRTPPPLHESLWRLPNVKWIYTTNFDCLIEDALRRPKQLPLVITRSIEISNVLKDQRVVFKPHGCARQSSSRQEFVITRNDYLTYSHQHTLQMLKTLYDLTTKAFLFLGYSLRDLNMRHIITEARRIGNPKCYAVLREASAPEARYWEKLGVTLIEADSNEYIAKIFSSFPPPVFEWYEKIDARIEEKTEIANKCLQSLKEAIAKYSSVVVIIDAGSTTLAFSKALAQEVRSGNDTLLRKVKIITNSSPVVDELSPAVERLEGETNLTVIGGALRSHTRAYTPDTLSARDQLKPFDGSTPILAFMGATAIDESGLKTTTEAEIPIKKAFVDIASEVYVLADHAKVRNRAGVYVYSPWDKDRMVIVTDDLSEMQQLSSRVKAIY